MKLCKKLVICLLAVMVILLCFSALPQNAQATDSDLYDFRFDGIEEGYVIWGCNKAISGDLVIPDTYSGYPVIGIESRVFYNFTGLTSVTIPETITYIGQYAFAGCTELTNITLPDSLRTYGMGIFKGCTGLTSVTLGNGIRAIPESMFEGCISLTSIIIPDQVRSISKNAFSGCTSLTSVTIGKGVSDIDAGTFNNCSALSKLSISDGIYDIDDTAFAGCTALPYNVYGNGKYLGNEENPYVILTGPVSQNIEDCQLHPETKAINHHALQDCSILTTVALGDSLVTIGDNAFLNCTNLNSVTLPDTVISIGAYAFSHCVNMRSVTLPDTVTNIGQGAFANCSSMTSIHIPEGIKVINDMTFGKCESLTNVVLPDSVTIIGKAAFSECTGLISVRVGTSSVVIREYAFEGCKRLESMNFPAGTDIENYSFDGCNSLKNVFYCGTSLEWAYSFPHKTNVALLNATSQNHKYENGDCIFCQPRDRNVWVFRLNDTEDLAQESFVYLNGLPYEVKTDDEGRYLELPKADNNVLVTYSYHEGDGQDIHTQYPTGMKVYMASGGKITYIPELDNLLQYSGSSIRISGKKGIRMITSIEKDKKSALTGKGLAGFTLVEYGTVLCLADEMPAGNVLVLDRSYARSNYAYKRGVADPVFATSGNLVQYTNVLVGFSMDQCIGDIAMRPYITLQDVNGEQVVLYGGTVYRSIGFIAYQNRLAFKPKTASYEYVWEIIHHVYGYRYDADYKE